MIEIKNKKAYFDYTILESIEAGISLVGTEIKSIRKGSVDLKDTFITIKNNEAFILNMYIAKYEEGNIFNHDERRTRKLLLHKKEIQKLKEKYAGQIEIQSGYEVEYLPGEEENLKELKAETDKLVLGQHFVYDDNQKLYYTKYLNKDEYKEIKEKLGITTEKEILDKDLEEDSVIIIFKETNNRIKFKNFRIVEGKPCIYLQETQEQYGNGIAGMIMIFKNENYEAYNVILNQE